VLITRESSICAFSAYNLTTALFCYYTLYIIIFLRLLSTNHTCTQPCYFPLLLEHASQKMKMVWNSSTRSSRLALPRLYILVDYGVFCYSASVRELFSFFKDIIYVIIILYL
jgi:hypothetical protein